jgi:hypothetical protein
MRLGKRPHTSRVRVAKGTLTWLRDRCRYCSRYSKRHILASSRCDRKIFARRDPDCLCGLEIDHELESGRLLFHNGAKKALIPLENFVDERRFIPSIVPLEPTALTLS